MKLEEYIQKQKENHDLYTQARVGEEWYSHSESSRIMNDMIELEKGFFLENFDKYADLLETKMDKNGDVQVKGPGGSYLFTLTAKEASALPSASNFLEKVTGKKEQGVVLVNDERNSNFINWGSESDNQVSEILNQVKLLESKFISKPHVQSDFKSQLNKIKQSASQSDSADNVIENEENTSYRTNPK